MAAGWRSLRSLGAVARSWRLPRPRRAAAEPYRPDPALVAAAKKEGQVLIYTTLIVDQIVRPLIRDVPGAGARHRRQIRARRQHGAGGAADQRGARQPDAGRYLAHGRRRRPADRGRHRGAVRPAERQGAAARPMPIRTGAGSRPTSPCARSPTTPRSFRRHRRRAATTTCSTRASRASSSGTRTPCPAPTASSAPCSSTWARRKASPICARSPSRTSCRCRWRSAPCSTA